MCMTVGNPSDACCESIPPVKTLGSIARWMRPTLINDYEGISTHAWSTGNSGIRNGDADREALDDKVCFFHEVINEDVLSQTPVLHIMAPVRWVMMAPEADGGLYDAWESLETEDNYGPGLFGHEGTANYAEGAITPKLIPRQWHCRFDDDLMEFNRFQLPATQQCDRHSNPAVNAYADAGFESLSPDIAVLPSLPPTFNPRVPFHGVYAVRHVINGVPVKSLLLWGDASPVERAAQNWKIRVRPGDVYAIDIWYRIGIDLDFPTEYIDDDGTVFDDEVAYGIVRDSLTGQPFKVCAYIPVSLAATGRLFGVAGDLKNVDFSPQFNALRQTFEVFISGHRGWTLADGTNFGVMTASVAGAGASWSGNNASFCRGILLDFAREIAEVMFLPGNAMRAVHPDLTGPVLYRPRNDDSDHYRRNTVSTEFGAIQHAQTGPFDPDGTTVFELVPWTAGVGLLDGADLEQKAIGSSTGEGTRFRALPKTITVKRINQ